MTALDYQIVPDGLNADQGLLVRRAQAGDPTAFDEIVDVHWAPLVAIARGRVGRAEDAEDAVLKAMMKAYRAINGFDPDRPIRPWLIAIVTNCCTDGLRRRRDEVAIPEGFAEFRAGPDDVAGEVETLCLSEAVSAAIAKLPGRYAEVMTLRVVDDLPIEEIALRMKRPVGTIKSWLFRARSLLQRSLSPTFG